MHAPTDRVASASTEPAASSLALLGLLRAADEPPIVAAKVRRVRA